MLLLCTTSQIHAQSDSVTIYIRSGAIHSDVVMPLRSEQTDWTVHFPAPPTYRAADSLQWLSIGWGSKEFYLDTPTWADLTAATVVKALTGTGHSAMHIMVIAEPALGEKCFKLRLSSIEYESLSVFVRNSVKLNEKNLATMVAYKPTGWDAFYNARGNYNLLNTCNTWTNRALKCSNQKACKWAIFYQQIFKRYKM